MENIIQLIIAERKRQDEKWGADRDLDNYVWMAILSEEVIEVLQAVLKADRDNLFEELVQVAAVCVAWLESIWRNI